MGKRWWLGVGLLLVAVVAIAGGRGAVRKQIESSMLVTGTIDVDRQGGLASYAIDQPEKIPEGIRDFLGRNIAQWKFDVGNTGNGLPANAVIRNTMSLRIVAKKQDNGDFEVRLAAVDFRPTDVSEGAEVRAAEMVPPRFPDAAAKARASGTVYLLVKVGRDGRVEDVFAEQTNLRVLTSEPQMRALRNQFEKASLAAARRWTFTPPQVGDLVDDDSWVLRVPVDYAMGTGKPAYGEWTSYVPGPRQPNPWQDDRADQGFSPDALAATGGIYMATGNGLKLVTPLQPRT